MLKINKSIFCLGDQASASMATGMANMTGMSGMSGMSGMPGMATMQAMPMMSGMSGMSAMPGMAGMPGMGGMPAMSGMSGMMGMPGMTGQNQQYVSVPPQSQVSPKGSRPLNGKKIALKKKLLFNASLNNEILWSVYLYFIMDWTWNCFAGVPWKT